MKSDDKKLSPLIRENKKQDIVMTDVEKTHLDTLKDMQKRLKDGGGGE